MALRVIRAAAEQAESMSPEDRRELAAALHLSATAIDLQIKTEGIITK